MSPLTREQVAGLRTALPELRQGAGWAVAMFTNAIPALLDSAEAMQDGEAELRYAVGRIVEQWRFDILGSREALMQIEPLVEEVAR